MKNEKVKSESCAPLGRYITGFAGPATPGGKEKEKKIVQCSVFNVGACGRAKCYPLRQE